MLCLNSNMLRLGEKASRFSTITMFNGGRGGLIPFNDNHIATTNPQQDQHCHIVLSDVPVAFPRTDEEYKKWFSYCLTVFQVWLMAYLTIQFRCSLLVRF